MQMSQLWSIETYSGLIYASVFAYIYMLCRRWLTWEWRYR